MQRREPLLMIYLRLGTRRGRSHGHARRFAPKATVGNQNAMRGCVLAVRSTLFSGPTASSCRFRPRKTRICAWSTPRSDAAKVILLGEVLKRRWRGPTPPLRVTWGERGASIVFEPPAGGHRYASRTAPPGRCERGADWRHCTIVELHRTALPPLTPSG
jgi:hypothetical protein